MQIDALWAGLNNPDTGQSYSGAIVGFFYPGTTTPKAVWYDANRTLPSAAGVTQVTLDSNGTARVFGFGKYKINIYDPDDTLLTTPLSGSIDGVTYGQASDGNVNYVNIVSDLEDIEGVAGDIYIVLGYYAAGDGGGGEFKWDASSTDTEIMGHIVKVTGVATGRWFRIMGDTIFTQHAGDHADGATNDADHITAALAYAVFVRDSTIRNPTVKMRNGGDYLISSGITIPYGITLDANGSYISYSGSGVAVTAGDKSDTLNYFTNFINFSLKLNSHTATGVKALATTESKFKGYVEGYTVGITNARTSIGFEVNGGTTSNASSYANVIEVFSNHCHIGFKVTGTKVGGLFVSGTQPTSNLFLNCTAICDQSDDNASYGWFWDDMGFQGLGSGAVMENCNAEDCNIGLYFGDGCRGINFKGRVEIATTATSRQVHFHTNTDIIQLAGDGFQVATIGDVAGGIVNFAGSTHSIMYDQNGHTRLCGNGTNITSGNPTFAIGHDDIFLKSDTNINIITKDTSTGTGSIFIQPGGGSADNGGYIKMYGHNHSVLGTPTANIKNLEMGPSLGGVINFMRYFDASQTLARLEYNGVANDTSLWLWDTNSGTLKRVTVGIADSGGTGYRLLRIAN